MAQLEPASKADTRVCNAMHKDKATLQARLAGTDALLEAIGGQLTEDEAKALILGKLYRIANAELNRYLNAGKRESARRRR